MIESVNNARVQRAGLRNQSRDQCSSIMWMIFWSIREVVECEFLIRPKVDVINSLHNRFEKHPNMFRCKVKYPLGYFTFN